MHSLVLQSRYDSVFAVIPDSLISDADRGLRVVGVSEKTFLRRVFQILKSLVIFKRIQRISETLYSIVMFFLQLVLYFNCI